MLTSRRHDDAIRRWLVLKLVSIDKREVDLCIGSKYKGVGHVIKKIMEGIVTTTILQRVVRMGPQIFHNNGDDVIFGTLL